MAVTTSRSGEFGAHPGIHKETAVRVDQHLLCLKTLQTAMSNECAQDAAAKGGFCLGHCVGVAYRIQDRPAPSSDSRNLSRVRKMA
jgi:hypothetical protein